VGQGGVFHGLQLEGSPQLKKVQGGGLVFSYAAKLASKWPPGQAGIKIKTKKSSKRLKSQGKLAGN
jgi:hypothetical protein